MGSKWPSYELQMSVLRASDGVFETKHQASHCQSAAKVEFPSSDQAFWNSFSIKFWKMLKGKMDPTVKLAFVVFLFADFLWTHDGF